MKESCIFHSNVPTDHSDLERWVGLALRRDATYDIKAHVHDSGNPDFNFLAVVAVETPEVPKRTSFHCGNCNTY